MGNESKRNRAPWAHVDPTHAIDSVFGAVWSGSGLTRRERHWITLTAVTVTGVQTPLDVHVRTALHSRGFTSEDMVEFALHFAHCAGWPLSSQLYVTIRRELASLSK